MSTESPFPLPIDAKELTAKIKRLEQDEKVREEAGHWASLKAVVDGKQKTAGFKNPETGEINEVALDQDDAEALCELSFTLLTSLCENDPQAAFTIGGNTSRVLDRQRQQE